MRTAIPVNCVLEPSRSAGRDPADADARDRIVTAGPHHHAGSLPMPPGSLFRRDAKISCHCGAEIALLGAIGGEVRPDRRVSINVADADDPDVLRNGLRLVTQKTLVEPHLRL